MTINAPTAVSYLDFAKLDIRVGTIIVAKLNAAARKPAYVLEIDFGDELGKRTSSAQIIEAYKVDTLKGLQVAAVMNFPPKQVAGVTSEVLVLGIVHSSRPTILLVPSDPVENGSQVL